MQSFWQPSLPRPVVVVTVLLACAVLWKKRPDAAPLLVGPALVTLAAAAAHLYPFSGRAILFLTPTGLLAAADAVESLVEGLARLRVPRPASAAALSVSLAAAAVMHLPVYRHEETRPVLAAVAASLRPGDVLYVYYGAERAVRFYGPRVGIHPSDATFGGCHRGQPREYLRELDRFRGRPRVWVVFAHAVSSLAEQPTIRGYLGRIGKRVEGFEEVEASAELYDLSDPGRLQATTAEIFPLSESNPELAARFGCGHGPLATTPAEWR